MAKKIIAQGTKPKPKTLTEGGAASIDDIFATSKAKTSKAEVPPSDVAEPKKKMDKGKSKEDVPAVSSSRVLDGDKKKKKKKEKSVPSFNPEEEPEMKVETVVDPSTIPVVVPEPPVASKVKKVSKRDRKNDEEDEMFKDSRGTGPRRKTEEGFLIFKEAELKIDPEAGGTPLCPFDCECCF